MIANLIPAGARKYIYAILGAANVAELTFDLVPSPLDGKVLMFLTAIGFAQAFVRTTDIIVVAD
jgi:hypothetical protein